MHPWRLPMLLLVAALLSTPSPADDRILDFHSNINVLPDASVEVHETIRVRSEINGYIQHGIVRDIPTGRTDQLGPHRTVDFNLLEVRRDGESETYTQEPIQDGVRITIGSKSKLLEPGEYTYELTYTATREVRFFPDHDELYWNVTSNEWQFPIDQASARVTLPEATERPELKVAGYTGPRGSRDHNLRFFRDGDSTAGFATTAPLGSNEGLSIIVSFPKGLVTEPSAADRRQWFLEDNALTLVGLAGLLLLLLYYYVVWRLEGRDPRPGTIVVSYEPPTGISPPAMRYLQNMKYDDGVFASAVLDLAVKRYLTIQQKEGTYQLKKLKAEDDSLPYEESEFLQALFAGQGEVEIKINESSAIGTARDRLRELLNTLADPTLFTGNASRVVIGSVVSLAVFAGMLLSGRDRNVFLAFIPAIFLLLAALGSTPWFRKNLVVGGFMGQAVMMFWVVAAIVGALALGALLGLLPMLIVVALLATNYAFAYWLRAYTPEGRRVLDQIEGFKLFLTEVHSDRLQRVNAPAKTSSLFEKYLPYALALGLEQAWAQQFLGVVTAAAAVAEGRPTAYSPAWYSTDSGGFDSGRFAATFRSHFSSAVSSATAPASSGSGGGGW